MQIVSRTLAADHVTPVRAYAALRARSPGTSSFLLESVVPGERWGRYSILGYRAREEARHPAGSDALALLGRDMARVPVVEGLAARFSQALIGQKVGSRVIVTMPPALGYGAQEGHPLQPYTLVFLIDIVETSSAG